MQHNLTGGTHLQSTIDKNHDPLQEVRYFTESAELPKLFCTEYNRESKKATIPPREITCNNSSIILARHDRTIIVNKKPCSVSERWYIKKLNAENCISLILYNVGVNIVLNTPNLERLQVVLSQDHEIEEWKMRSASFPNLKEMVINDEIFIIEHNKPQNTLSQNLNESFVMTPNFTNPKHTATKNLNLSIKLKQEKSSSKCY